MVITCSCSLTRAFHLLFLSHSWFSVIFWKGIHKHDFRYIAHVVVNLELFSLSPPQVVYRLWNRSQFIKSVELLLLLGSTLWTFMSAFWNLMLMTFLFNCLISPLVIILLSIGAEWFFIICHMGSEIPVWAYASVHSTPLTAFPPHNSYCLLSHIYYRIMMTDLHISCGTKSIAAKDHLTCKLPYIHQKSTWTVCV